MRPDRYTGNLSQGQLEATNRSSVGNARSIQEPAGCPNVLRNKLKVYAS